MPSTRIAIATCAMHPALTAVDALLREALQERGVEAVPLVWDDAAADWAGFDLCLVRSTWDYNRKHDGFLAWTRRVEATTPLRNPAGLIAWNSEKTYLRELSAQGVRTVPTAWVASGPGADLDAVLAHEGWEEAVVKPVVDLGARNLHRARRGEGSAALESVLRRHDAMVQPFLPSVQEQGEVSLIFIAGELTHAVRKRPAPGDFRVQSLWGGTASAIEPDRSQVRLAERAMALLEEPPLYARVDLVAGPDQMPCLMELELIEPNLYLDVHPPAAARLADAVIAQL